MRTKNKMFIIMIGLLLSSGIIINNNSLNNYNDAFALEYSTNAGVNFTLKPSISVSLSSSDLHISELNPGTSSDSNIITINILSNNSTGYVVNSSVGNDSDYASNLDNLVNTASNKYKFTSLDYGSSIGNMADSTVDDNTWGYSYDNGEGWSSYSGLPLYNDEDHIATLKATNAPSVADGDSIAFKIAAKASHTQAAGDYTNIINFIVVGNATPVSFYDAFTIAAESDSSIKQLNGYYKMQDMSAEICSNIADLQTATLIDVRDNNTYTIAKISDACWMTQNLRIAEGTRLTKADSNVSTDYTIPATDLTNGDSYTDGRIHYGKDANHSPTMWYNYCTASAGTACTTNTPSTSHDICPLGWQIPPIDRFKSITGQLSMFSPVAGGLFISGELQWITFGRWWSTTEYSNTNWWTLVYGSNSLQIDSAGNRGSGYYIRCIATN